MPVPSQISDLDTNAANNSPPGTESAKGNIDNYLRAAFAFIKQNSNLIAGATATLASASTVAIGAAAVNNIIISGTTTITAFDSIGDGAIRNVTFSGALTLTHNATSLILPGAANITTAANDTAIFKSLGGGNWQCLFFQRAGSGVATASASFADNGYQKLPSGLILQWGKVTTTGALVGATWTFPIAFPNRPLLYHAMTENSSSQSYYANIGPGTSTANAASVVISSTYAGTAINSCFALGY